MTKSKTENQMPLFGVGLEVPDKTVITQKSSGKKSPKRALPTPEKKVTPKKKIHKITTSPKSLSGLVPEGDVRLTANIREDLHLRLKIAAAKQRTTIGELIEVLVDKYIK